MGEFQLALFFHDPILAASRRIKIRLSSRASMPTTFCPGCIRRLLPSASRVWRALGPAFALAALVLVRPAVLRAAAPDVERIMGPEACAECHIQEIETWKLSVHFKTFNKLPARPETSVMLGKLGLGRIKQEPQCMACHFLNKQVEDQLTAVAGITCESCHGGSRDWATTHGDYGKGVTKATETPEHRDRRLAQARAAGLIYPDNLYALGASCYACHIMNDEKIVNQGGHSASTAAFNLLTWSQGEVRHTILHTGNKDNPPASPEHRRRLYVLGVILETEFCFRAVARATEKANYGVTLARRADDARKLLAKIQGLAPTPELAAIVQVAQATRLRLNNAAELNRAAAEIAGLGREFVAKVTGAQLAGIDALVPGPELYQGKPFQVAGAP
jgi:Cytochrome c554 and c-prime